VDLSIPERDGPAVSYVIDHGFGTGEAPGSKPDYTEDPQCMWGWCILSLTSWVKHLPAGMLPTTHVHRLTYRV
ncbi:hypothetical protein AVEN_97122-1, partial [Araneus ventricosus]